MKKYFLAIRFILLIITSVLLISCSGIEQSRTLDPVKLEIASRQQYPFRIAKVQFEQRSNTYFLMEHNRPNIYFYRGDRQINQIGGFGNDRSNFFRLNDIAVDADGNLLALDSFTRLIRKYTSDGKWIADIDISQFSQPTRFCVTPDNDILVFDSLVRELYRISSLDGKIMYSFGRFQTDGVHHISAARDMYAIISEDKTQTTLFSAMGQYLYDVPSQLVLDRFKNQYRYSEGILRLVGSEVLLPLGFDDRAINLFSAGQTLFITNNDTVITIIPIYR